MDIQKRLDGLEHELSQAIEDLVHLRDHYENLDVSPTYEKDVLAREKISFLTSKIEAYSTNRALVRRLLGGTDPLPLPEWVPRELAGETLTKNGETGEWEPYRG